MNCPTCENNYTKDRIGFRVEYSNDYYTPNDKIDQKPLFLSKEISIYCNNCNTSGYHITKTNIPMKKWSDYLLIAPWYKPIPYLQYKTWKKEILKND